MVHDLLKETCNGSLNPDACFQEMNDHADPPCQGSCRVNRSNEGRLAGGQRVLYEEVFRRGSGAGGSADDAAA